MDSLQLSGFVIIILIFLFALFQGLIEHYEIKFMHESGIVLLISVGVSVILKVCNSGVIFQFSGDSLFYIVLPPIIFSAGYNMKKREFFEYLPYISMFGLLGTCINFATMIMIMQWFNNLDLFSYSLGSTGDLQGNTFKLQLSEIAMFAGIICSSDVVAPLTLINKDKYPKLFSIVFGEGIVNDAMSIILFQCVVLVLQSEHVQGSFNFSALMVKLLYVSTCSLLIGLVGGLLPASFLKVTKYLHFNPINETIFLMFFGMITYLICELLDLSGILGLLVCSILISHYAFYNLSAVGQQSSSAFFSTLSYLSEAFIFIYLGLCSVLRASDWSLSLTLYGLLAVLISRAIAITSTSIIFKAIYWLSSVQFQLDPFDLLIIYISGSIRGAIAYGIVLSVDTVNASVIKSSCLLMVIITTVVFGGSMGLIIKFLFYLKLKCNQNNEQQMTASQNAPELQDINDLNAPCLSNQQSNFYNPIFDTTNNHFTHKYSALHRWWRRIDDKFIKKYLVYDYLARQQEFKTIEDTCRQMEGGDYNRGENIKYSAMQYGYVSEIFHQASVTHKLSQRISKQLTSNVNLSKYDKGYLILDRNVSHQISQTHLQIDQTQNVTSIKALDSVNDDQNKDQQQMTVKKHASHI